MFSFASAQANYVSFTRQPDFASAQPANQVTFTYRPDIAPNALNVDCAYPVWSTGPEPAPIQLPLSSSAVGSGSPTPSTGTPPPFPVKMDFSVPPPPLGYLPPAFARPQQPTPPATPPQQLDIFERLAQQLTMKPVAPTPKQPDVFDRLAEQLKPKMEPAESYEELLNYCVTHRVMLNEIASYD